MESGNKEMVSKIVHDFDLNSLPSSEEVNSSLETYITRDMNMDMAATNNGGGEVDQSVAGGAAALGWVTLAIRQRQRRRGAILPIKNNKYCTNINCGTRETVMWRKGPLGLNTLCNACGIQYTKESVGSEGKKARRGPK